ncbi:hypothetical protein CH373_16020 [Leptospira perolatii]|uniref:Ribosomal RNA small subunit methyltransferase E n=1 Tax=Leptospira perolatii TaxID=2023191 RepID=A0A2M9ZJA4_9LEPT|nr:RsmE family RNA methyltransferase [Leptospira perolatii]PJZ68404.1 hypothetical protein CH360_16220 [Leptospira perolatii]PJZ72102.1 hypothetical protein CH373_16020 [Leptospira perolatii]
MNLLLLSNEDAISNTANKFELKSPRVVQHIQKILKKNPGDRLKTALANRSIGIFRIEKMDETSIVGTYRPLLVPSRRSPKLILWSAIQRPPTVEKLLQLSGTWGVHELEFFATDLSRKEYFTSPIWKSEVIRSELRIGMEQGWNAYDPVVKLNFSSAGNHLSPKLQTKSLLDRILEKNKNMYYLDRKGSDLSVYFSSNPGFLSDSVFLLGPEPGWSKREKKILSEAGCKPVKVSSKVLRTEQALAFLLSRWEEILARK